MAPGEFFRVLAAQLRVNGGRGAFAVGVLGKEGVEFFYSAVGVAGWVVWVDLMVARKALADLFELLAALLKLVHGFVVACKYFCREFFGLKLSASGVKFCFEGGMGVLLA